MNREKSNIIPMTANANDSPPLLAFMVTEPYENTGGVIFAHTAIVARRFGANEWHDGDISGMTVRRAADLDHYAPGPVPASALIAKGWWFECSGCAETISDEWLYERGLSVEGVRGSERGAVFCCACCEGEYRDRRRAKETAGQAVIRGLIERIRQRFGDVEIGKTRHYTTMRDGLLTTQEAEVEFVFPGQRIAPASLRLASHYPQQNVYPPSFSFYCCNGDREAFEAFAKESHRA